MGELSLIFENVDLYILVFARVAGIVIFNPILSRNNVPSMLRTGIALGTTILLTPLIPLPEWYQNGVFDFILCFGKEIFVGFLLGYIFNVFYYMIMTAGDILDTSLGFAMAKVLDPATNIQSAFVSNVLNILFVMYFFATNSHIALIDLAVSSYDFVGIGIEGLDLYSAASFAVDVFAEIFGVAMKLAFPFVATEFILEVSMGVLMKLIPQIHVFVIQFQLKILLAIFLLILMAGPIAAFIDNYILIMFDYLQNALRAVTG
ncbi:MAG: flagellar biosynthetic protein FliR [Porcipelethomonas sp.]